VAEKGAGLTPAPSVPDTFNRTHRQVDPLPDNGIVGKLRRMLSAYRFFRLPRGSLRNPVAVLFLVTAAFTTALGEPAVPVWQRWEKTLTGTRSYQNPYADVELKVVYTAPDGHRLRSYGFWDGGNTFKIRCAFDMPGVWHWRTTCSDIANHGLQGQSGTVRVTAYHGSNPLYGHGFLRASRNRRYLTFHDGTPFRWLGDTAWAAPLKATAAEWRIYVRARAGDGFTVTQIAPASWWAGERDAEGHLPFAGPGLARWEPAFWQGFEAKVEAANRAGLVVLVVGVMEPVRRYPARAEAERFARRLAARLFGNFVIFSPSFDSPWMELGNQVGRALRQATAVHLITQHPGTPSGRPTQIWSERYYDESYLSFAGVQTGHNGGNVARSMRQAREWNLHLWRREPHKPVINLETMYDAQGRTNWRTRDARALGYLSLLSGAMGYTYGAGETKAKVPKGHGGLYDWCTDPAAYDYWRKVLDWPGAKQMSYLARLFGSLPWWRLQPRPDLIANQPAAETRKMAVARTSKGDCLVAYLPDDDRIELNLPPGRFPLQARWYNPVTGAWSGRANEVNEPGRVSFHRPSSGDWVLVLTAS
jgi:Protein of unknown function (DUF4038)/Domain of unknown function (DUF5060)/Putative collagen-binding domain of a collagenase